MSKHQNNPIRVYSLTISSSHPSENLLLPIKDLEQILKKECKSYVFSLEVGSQGRHHYQCVIHLLERTRNPKTQFIKHIGKELIPYWEFSPCSNIRALKEYCAKSPLGEVSRFTRATKALPLFDQIQLRHAQLGMLEILEKEADDRAIFVFSDPQGGDRKDYFHQTFNDERRYRLRLRTLYWHT